jgi:tetratricopeptide (TPR) repeat protein
MHVKNAARRGCFLLILALAWRLALIAQNASDVEQKVGALEQQVQAYLQDRKPELAIPVLRQIVSLDPANLNGQGNLGVLLFFDGRYAEAIPHLRAALRLKPDLWRIAALLGIAEKRTGGQAEARKHLEQAFPNLEEKNIQLQAGLELIELYSASAESGKALSLAVKLQELAPESPRVPFVAFQIARQVMDESLLNLMMIAPDSAEMHMIMANELARQGNQADSIAHYRDAIRRNASLPGAHFELAEQLRAASDPALNAQAEQEYKAALEVNRFDAKSWRQLGAILAAKGEFKAAKEHYRKALALNPHDAEAKTGLANALVSTDRSDEAMSLLTSALKDDPTNIAAHYRLSLLYRRAGRTEDAQRETEAFEHYKAVRDKLDRVFKQLAGAVRGNPEHATQ